MSINFSSSLICTVTVSVFAFAASSFVGDLLWLWVLFSAIVAFSGKLFNTSAVLLSIAVSLPRLSPSPSTKVPLTSIAIAEVVPLPSKVAFKVTLAFCVAAEGALVSFVPSFVPLLYTIKCSMRLLLPSRRSSSFTTIAIRALDSKEHRPRFTRIASGRGGGTCGVPSSWLSAPCVSSSLIELCSGIVDEEGGPSASSCAVALLSAIIVL
mmetsp:Transcript_42526/g.89271  ORF Transcript_42526/g.89271 Transcript_42526/m.89271 type:complete len:210 (+) Transcript_42526:201-830(+)